MFLITKLVMSVACSLLTDACQFCPTPFSYTSFRASHHYHDVRTVIVYLNLPADCRVSAGLGSGGEAEVSAGGPPAPLGVKCTISPHLDLAQQ